MSNLRKLLLGSLSALSMSFSSPSSGTTNNLLDVTSSASMTVAVGASGTILSSPDCINWTVRTSGTTNNLYAVRHNGTYFVAVGSGGTVLRSSDGITWSAQTIGTTNTLEGLCVKGTTFYVGGTGGVCYSSSNGASWTAKTTVPIPIQKLTTDGVNICTSSGSGFASYNSADSAVTWSLNGLGNVLNTEWLGTYALAFLSSGQSTDGIYKSDTASLLANYTKVHAMPMRAAAKSASCVIAVGGNGSVLVSTDSSATFSDKKQAGSTTNWNSVIFNQASGLFVIVGNAGNILLTRGI